MLFYYFDDFKIPLKSIRTEREFSVDYQNITELDHQDAFYVHDPDGKVLHPETKAILFNRVDGPVFQLVSKSMLEKDALGRFERLVKEYQEPALAAEMIFDVFV